MSNFSKIRAILEAWLNYIYLENLSNAEVEAGTGKKQKVWDKGIQLVGDQLLIDKAIFPTLKTKYREPEEKGKEKDFQIAVAFGQIYRVEKGERKFKPLFTLDISSLIGGRYCSKGWNVTEFEFQPVIPN